MYNLNMKIETCDIEGLIEITPDVFSDRRGYFFESFNLNRYVNDEKIFQNYALNECP